MFIRCYKCERGDENAGEMIRLQYIFIKCYLRQTQRMLYAYNANTERKER